MPKTNDRVRETTTTTGTGTITLAGAQAGFQSFSAAFSVGDSVMYAIIDPTNNTWEVGIGTLATSNTLARDTVQESSNSDALVNFASGTKDVFATMTSRQAMRINIGKQIMCRRISWLQTF